MGNAQGSTFTHLIPPSAFLHVATPRWAPFLSLMRNRRVSDSKTGPATSRSSPGPLHSSNCPFCSLSSEHSPQDRLGLVATRQELHKQDKPIAYILEVCLPLSVGFLGEIQHPAGAKAGTVLAPFPQVNRSHELGGRAGVCSMLGMERAWDGAVVPEKPPGCLLELSAGLIEAMTVEVGPFHHLGS